MTIKAVVYRFAIQGGAVEIEDHDNGDNITLVTSQSASSSELRRRAAKKLRALADNLEKDAKHRKRSDGMIETALPVRL